MFKIQRFNTTCPLRSMMGYTIFGKSQEILPDLVGESLEKAGNLYVHNQWSPSMLLANQIA